MENEDLLPIQLKNIVHHLPDLPGVYQYFNKDGKIIYVGKAKNLKKRVSSYFSKTHDNRKTIVLVKNISDIKHIVVDSEEDALLLENNLIKKYQPKYNVLLKDDKSFPWICVKNEPFPRVFITRNVVRDGSSYFGPYTSIFMARTVLDVIKRLYPVRNCSLNLSSGNIDKGKYKVCLEFQIGNCKGPCEKKQSAADYLENINLVKEILKGNLSSVESHLRDGMELFAREYKFEEAANYKNKMAILEKYKSKSTIFSASITNIDVFSFDEDDLYGYVNYLRVVNGAIIQAHTLEIKKRLDESKEELLALGIIEIKQSFLIDSKEMLIPFPIDMQLKEVKIVVPKIGEKRKLLDLSLRNVRLYKLDKKKQLSLKNPESRTTALLVQMQKDLRMQLPPHRIECFDNSNIQGTNPVAACVVFIDGKPAKKEYRHFNVKTVEGPDDFATMEEIVFRRYDRVINENGALPQLIVIDGGKGQLTSALKALDKLNVRGQIAIIGVAKRLEEIIYPDDPVPMYLDKNSITLRVLQNIRNEAHRFGITFHRNKRSNDFIVNELAHIPGIGEKTIEVLMRKFKSINRLKISSKTKIIEEIGISKANKIENYFKKVSK
jgi:excinuclease ABC subunit C